MPKPGREQRRREVVHLVDDGQRLHGQGDLAGALDRYQRACALVREAIEVEPADTANAQQLGAMQYTAGEWQLEARDYPAAVEALNEAEQAYAGLGGAAAQLVTDVVIRRARVHAAAGQPLSAIADAQQAVIDCLNRVADETDHSRRLDAARVIAHASQVELSIGGDPDLAVAAADWALREYLAAFRQGDQFALPAVHAPAVRIAGSVACIVHTAAGRTDLAEMAHWFVMVASGGEESVGADAVAAYVSARQPTLARVLDSAGRYDLVEALTAPAADVALLVPAMRCHAQVAPAYAPPPPRVSRR